MARTSTLSAPSPKRRNSTSGRSAPGTPKAPLRAATPTTPSKRKPTEDPQTPSSKRQRPTLTVNDKTPPGPQPNAKPELRRRNTPRPLPVRAKKEGKDGSSSDEESTPKKKKPTRAPRVSSPQSDHDSDETESVHSDVSTVVSSDSGDELAPALGREFRAVGGTQAPNVSSSSSPWTSEAVLGGIVPENASDDSSDDGENGGSTLFRVQPPGPSDDAVGEEGNLAALLDFEQQQLSQPTEKTRYCGVPEGLKSDLRDLLFADFAQTPKAVGGGRGDVLVKVVVATADVPLETLERLHDACAPCKIDPLAQFAKLQTDQGSPIKGKELVCVLVVERLRTKHEYRVGFQILPKTRGSLVPVVNPSKPPEPLRPTPCSGKAAIRLFDLMPFVRSSTLAFGTGAVSFPNYGNEQGLVATSTEVFLQLGGVSQPFIAFEPRDAPSASSAEGEGTRTFTASASDGPPAYELKFSNGKVAKVTAPNDPTRAAEAVGPFAGPKLRLPSLPLTALLSVHRNLMVVDEKDDEARLGVRASTENTPPDAPYFYRRANGDPMIPAAPELLDEAQDVSHLGGGMLATTPPTSRSPFHGRQTAYGRASFPLIEPPPVPTFKALSSGVPLTFLVKL